MHSSPYIHHSIQFSIWFDSSEQNSFYVTCIFCYLLQKVKWGSVFTIFCPFYPYSKSLIGEFFLECNTLIWVNTFNKIKSIIKLNSFGVLCSYQLNCLENANTIHSTLNITQITSDMQWINKKNFPISVSLLFNVKIQLATEWDYYSSVSYHHYSFSCMYNVQKLASKSFSCCTMCTLSALKNNHARNWSNPIYVLVYAFLHLTEKRQQC